MTERDAFLQAIIERPDDDTPRLVFSDWLDDHGEADRAELIRLQCALHSLPSDAPEVPPLREREESLEARRDDFLAPFTQLGLSFGEEKSDHWTVYRCKADFRRGFVEEVTVPGLENLRAFVRSAEAVFRLTPLRYLKVTDVPSESQADDQGYPIGMWFPDTDFIGDEDLAALVGRPEMTRLSTLLLRLDLGTREAQALAASPFLTSRTTLLLYPGVHDGRQPVGPGYRHVHEGDPEEVRRILSDRFGDSVRWCN